MVTPVKDSTLQAATRRPVTDDERGIALALVLFALVIMGAVLSGSFLAVRLDRNSASATGYAADAQAAAEAGLAEVWANWDPTVHSVMPLWDGTTATELSTPLHNLGSTSLRQIADTIRRMNPYLFVVRSYGVRHDAAGNVLSSLGVASMFRIVKPTISVNAAVTVMDPLNLNGNAFLISGVNVLPAQWGAGECAALDAGNSDDVVGIRSASTSGVNSADLNNLAGYPALYVENDATITNSTFQNYLDYTYNTLAAAPGVKVLPNTTPYNGVAPVVDNTTSPASCDRTQLLNLGEPFRAPTLGVVPECYGYFPVVHSTGSQVQFAAGNRGQGTLLVDGNMELNGGFEWVGLIIVRGAITINGTGNKLTGAVFAQGVNLVTAGAVSGNVEIKYSQCAITKAVGGATLAAPLGQRAYTQLY
jgi:hypothetical protein